jgi:16S rRNA (guanine527-N7)-methyltransferase
VKHSALTLPDVSRETEERLRLYADAIRRWNPTINLVSKADLPDLWHRHILDSLQLLPLLPTSAARAIDLGSGGGLPAIVLAIASGIAFTLVESDTRKSAFLREAIRATGASATVVNARIEAANIPPATIVTARALAPLPRLLDLASRFLATGGVFLFPKGRNAQTELTEAQAEWQMETECFASAIDPDATVLRLSHVARRVPGS